jgi:VanZ family protein
MKRAVLPATALFGLLIVLIIVAADAGRIPKSLERLYDFPGGDKAGHFLLFGILSYLLNRSALTLFPGREPLRVVLSVSLILTVLIGLEEWSQSLFPARTMSLIDLLASYTGVVVFSLLAYRTKR